MQFETYPDDSRSGESPKRQTLFDRYLFNVSELKVNIFITYSISVLNKLTETKNTNWEAFLPVHSLARMVFGDSGKQLDRRKRWNSVGSAICLLVFVSVYYRTS